MRPIGKVIEQIDMIPMGKLIANHASIAFDSSSRAISIMNFGLISTAC